jgi:hypothetical protein
MLLRAVFPPLLAAAAAGLGAKVTASQFADPLVQLTAGFAVGGLIYVVAAAPQGAAWLSQDKVAKLHALRLFRFYITAARMVGLSVSGGPGHRRTRGKHRAPSADGYGWGMPERRR